MQRVRRWQPWIQERINGEMEDGGEIKPDVEVVIDKKDAGSNDEWLS
jgi:hypothetical protein